MTQTAGGRRRRATGALVAGTLFITFFWSGQIRAQAPSRPASSAVAQSAPAGVPLLPRTTPFTGREAGRRISRPQLSDLAPAALREFKTNPRVPEVSSGVRSVRDRAALRVAAPEVVTSFEGPNNDDNAALNGTWNRPPDTDIAVGPNHVGVVVNVVLTFYLKNGTEVLQDDLAGWFNNVCSGCDPFDPRIAYDPQEDHWIVIALQQAGPADSRVLVSVSQSSDPTGMWWNWALDGSLVHPTPTSANTWADYPDVGFDGILSSTNPSGAVYITTNNFTFSNNSFRTSVLYILSKAELYSGAALSYNRPWGQTNEDGSQAATLRAAKTYGNPGMEFLVNTRQNANYVTVWHVNPTYPPAMVQWVRHATITIGQYNIAPDAQQLGCGATLDTIDNRAYLAVWKNDRLYTTFTESWNWGTPATVEAAVRYLKINTSTNVAEINQRLGQDLFFYFMPAIGVDSAENIALTFTRSSTTEFAGMHQTGHRLNAPAPEPSALLAAGVQCNTGFRWGDYSGMAVDPANARTSWAFGEYAGDVPSVTLPDWDWRTRIGRLFYTTFADVPTTDWAYSWIEELYSRGITGGCGTTPLIYCPDNTISRREMAVFLVRGRGEPTPTGCSGVFSDVPASDWGCPWIERIYTLGITSGCAVSPLRYCPDNKVTRREMAVFLNKAADELGCPACPQDFADVPPTDWAFQWIERLYQRGITGGCAVSPLRYCPDSLVTRREMAVFIVRNWP